MTFLTLGHFLTSWRSFWRHDALFFRHDELFDKHFDVMTNFVWRYAVFLTNFMTNFLTSWCIVDAMHILTSWWTVWGHDIFLTSWQTCWRHDELCDAKTNVLTSRHTSLSKICHDVKKFIMTSKIQINIFTNTGNIPKMFTCNTIYCS